MDEPTAGVDAANVELLAEAIADWKQQGHDPARRGPRSRPPPRRWSTGPSSCVEAGSATTARCWTTDAGRRDHDDYDHDDVAGAPARQARLSPSEPQWT